MMDKKSIFKRELAGFFIITIVGTILHFCFEWSGGLKALAWLCTVNESVWEHLKMSIWPAFFYAVYEYFAFGRRNRNFFAAKAAALYIIPLTIITIYYTVKAITGHHYLWLDITLFVLANALSQFISYRLIISRKNYSSFNTAAQILILLIISAFALFTYFPPKLELFKDPPTGQYGIIKA